MEVWNGIRKKILVWNGIWNGRFLVWNGNEMEENCQYGLWKNRLPFHSIPCPALKCTIYATAAIQPTIHVYLKDVQPSRLTAIGARSF